MSKYVPPSLLNNDDYDFENNFSLWRDICNEIKQYGYDKYCHSIQKPYSDIIYKLQWPSDTEKEEFKNADYNLTGKTGKYIPFLIRGIVIDVEDGTITIVHEDMRDSWDAETLLKVRDCIRLDLDYHICAYEQYKNPVYENNSLSELKPGTMVLLALINLEVSSNSDKQILANYTDFIIVDDNLVLTEVYLDEYHNIHDTYDYHKLYEKIRDKLVEQQPNNSSSAGCYIATSVYGSYDCPEVWTLRRYRDYNLAVTRCGRLFIKCYYAISPKLVKWFGSMKWFRRFWKSKLDRMVNKLKAMGYQSTKYNDKY